MRPSRPSAPTWTTTSSSPSRSPPRRRSCGVSPTHLARGFTTAFGIAPHAYVVGRRLEAARDRILAGQPLADVATEVGFFDQAHLTHRFRRFLGVTPGRFPAG